MNIVRRTHALALILCILFPLSAYAEDVQRARNLSDDNITAFLQTMQDISLSQASDMSGGDIYDFLDAHIADQAHYRSDMTFNIPGMPREKNSVVMNKQEYMTSLLNGRGKMEAYETNLEIKELEITNSGRSATLKTVSKETGTLEWGEKDGEPNMVPVIGESECEQKIAISLTNVIQMVKAVCTTNIRFDPFAGEKLGDDPF